jgi:hypothetical protein
MRDAAAKAAGSPADHGKACTYSKSKARMRNPWIKKNPLMSMWLSGANAVMGSARSRVAAESKRQAAAMLAEGTKQMVRLWTAGLTPPTPRKKKKSR